MTDRRRIGALLMLSLSVAGVQAAPATEHAHAQHQHHTAKARPWTQQPLLVKARSANRSLALFRPQGFEAAQVVVMPSVEPDEDASLQFVPFQDGKAGVRSIGKRRGGWYRLLADGTGPNGPARAGTVTYFSNPGPAPRAMLARPYHGVEVVPDILPREHRHFRAGETWAFRLRRDGEPLAGHPALFETERGVSQVLFSDDQGLVRVTFPDDFPAEPADGDGHGGHRGGPRTRFVLSTRAESGDGTQLAAFNYEYRPGAYASKNLWLGIGFGLLGMVAAVPLVRQRKAGEVQS